MTVNASENHGSKQQPNFVAQVLATVVTGLRQNLLPSIISLTVGLALVVAYYAGGDVTSPAFLAVQNVAGRLGVGFSVLSTCFAAGVVPLLLQAARGQLPRSGRLFYIIANLVFWACVGVVAFYLYFGLGLIFGNGTDAGTVACKVIVDQFVFNPFFMYPFVVVPYFRWKDANFSCSKFRESLSNYRSLLLQYCSLNVTNWCTWVPGCCVVYSFPPVLQIPIFSVIVFFFSVLLGLVSKSSTSADVSGSASDPEKSVADIEIQEADSRPTAGNSFSKSPADRDEETVDI
eukprot:TRINITY_DN94143_c0_g1_i1.p1 TRINITY_DN94143_c0_g1~~TRINITY_DN94143_c0_g1_i1.p1  ORF type:complete len:289 (-),score=54.96 TRINITY_DN94143_c0_g1_i1:21-887(-)